MNGTDTPAAFRQVLSEYDGKSLSPSYIEDIVVQLAAHCVGCHGIAAKLTAIWQFMDTQSYTADECKATIKKLIENQQIG